MKNAIGVFDSGVGGLTVVKEIFKHLPNENILYFGDIARVPYGSKTPEEILDIGREIIDWMLTFNVKAVAMACNTSSALALDVVKKEYDIPIFGLIKPTANHIHSINNEIERVGLIATAATVKSKAYSKEIKKLSPEISVVEIPCPGLVEIIESGQVNSKVAYQEVKKFVDILISEDVDKIILGCTHYPFISHLIKEITANDNILINPAKFMVMDMKEKLSELQLINTFNPFPVKNFYVSASDERFINVGSLLLPGILSSSNVFLQQSIVKKNQQFAAM